jgi:hypothetical protein
MRFGKVEERGLFLLILITEDTRHYFNLVLQLVIKMSYLSWSLIEILFFR